MRWRFGRFQLDRESACLWEGEQRLTLRPKTFDLLVHLVEHAGELVRKETLLETVWPDTVVADGVLTTSRGNSGRCLGRRRSSRSSLPRCTAGGIALLHRSPR